MSEPVRDIPPLTPYEQRIDAEIGAYAQACLDVYATHETLRDRAVRRLHWGELCGVELEGPAEIYTTYAYALPGYVADLTAAAHQRAPSVLLGQDAMVWSDAFHTVHDYGISPRNTPVWASGLPAYTAMRIGMDETVLIRAQHEVATTGQPNTAVLDDAALPVSRLVIGLATDPNLTQSFYRKVRGSAIGGIVREIVAQQLSPRVRQVSGIAISLPRLPASQPGAAYATYIEGANDLDVRQSEARSIVARLRADLVPECQYLLREDLTEVQATIDGVRRLRAAALQNNRPITDAEMYHLMRQSVDTAPPDYRPQREHTFALIHALMNANPYGRLPF